MEILPAESRVNASTPSTEATGLCVIALAILQIIASPCSGYASAENRVGINCEDTTH